MGLSSAAASWGGYSVRFGQNPLENGLVLGNVVGWYDTPSHKVQITERQSGDGAHSINGDMVMYENRVVTMDVVAMAAIPPELQALMDQVNSMAHHIVTMSISDGGQETFARGFVEVEWEPKSYLNTCKGKITLVCSDPRRYGESHTAYIVPSGGLGGGLLYDDDGGYIVIPISFGGEPEPHNVVTISNGGTSTAYPTITVSGEFPDGVTISHGEGQLAYHAPIGRGASLVLDSLNRTASVNGVDTTRSLVARDFPAIRPRETATISAMAEGSGTVSVQSYDTYI